MERSVNKATVDGRMYKQRTKTDHIAHQKHFVLRSANKDKQKYTKK